MTLSISDTNKRWAQIAKTGFIYLLLALVLALFGAVYEVFSHGVYSYYMLYAFAFPLAGGALPFTEWLFQTAGCRAGHRGTYIILELRH